jgi:separase
MFIYCGHGSAANLHGLPSKDLSLIGMREKEFPSALLWGCSSVRLVQRGEHDPGGPLVPYLAQGAKFVVGNLWDVTDRDLDKLSLHCMNLYFEQEQKISHQKQVEHLSNIASCLSASRPVCKLSYAVASAAVVYGIPLAID